MIKGGTVFEYIPCFVLICECISTPPFSVDRIEIIRSLLLLTEKSRNYFVMKLLKQQVILTMIMAICFYDETSI